MPPLERTIHLILAILAFASFLYVLYSRVSIQANVEDEYVNRRFILVDALLAIAGIELIADAFRDWGDGPTLIAGAIAFGARGALMAGGLALALSFGAERNRRRTLAASHHRRAGDKRRQPSHR